MTMPPPPAGMPQNPPFVPAAPVAPAKQRNTVGLIALILAAVGFVFACIPGALIVGWILLPAAFVLGIVGVCLKNKVKWQSITAIILSVVGTIVGFVVFSAVVLTAVGTALDETELTIEDGVVSVEPAEESAAPAEEGAEGSGDNAGTRENPIALGSTITGDDWAVTINSVDLDATAAVLAENPINDEPDAGKVMILVNYTATYVGDNADGEMAAFTSVEYVTAGGVTVNTYDHIVLAPEAIDTTTTLYNGASVTGNAPFAVPTPVDGVLAVKADVFADTVFVAVQ